MNPVLPIPGKPPDLPPSPHPGLHTCWSFSLEFPAPRYLHGWLFLPLWISTQMSPPPGGPPGVCVKSPSPCPSHLNGVLPSKNFSPSEITLFIYLGKARREKRERETCLDTSSPHPCCSSKHSSKHQPTRVAGPEPPPPSINTTTAGTVCHQA